MELETIDTDIETPEIADLEDQQHIILPSEMTQMNRREMIKVAGMGGLAAALGLTSEEEAEALFYDEDHPMMKEILQSEFVDCEKAAFMWCDFYDDRREDESYKEYRARKEQIVKIWPEGKKSMNKDSNARFELFRDKKIATLRNRKTGKKKRAYHYYGVARNPVAYPNRPGGGTFCAIDLKYSIKGAGDTMEGARHTF